MIKIIKYAFLLIGILFFIIFMLYTGFDSHYRLSNQKFSYYIDFNQKIDLGIMNKSISMMNCSNYTNNSNICFK